MESAWFCDFAANPLRITFAAASQSNSHKCKRGFRQTCQEYPHEFSATPVSDLRCNLCDVLVKCDKKFFVESHRKINQHQGKLETKSKSQSMQTFLHFDQVNFKEQVVSSFLAADIPLHKQNHPSLKSLFARMGEVLPSETAARACVTKLASQK